MVTHMVGALPPKAVPTRKARSKSLVIPAVLTKMADLPNSGIVSSFVDRPSIVLGSMWLAVEKIVHKNPFEWEKMLSTTNTYSAKRQ